MAKELTYNSMAIDANGLVVAKIRRQIIRHGESLCAAFNNLKGLEKSAEITTCNRTTQGAPVLRVQVKMLRSSTKQAH